MKHTAANTPDLALVKKVMNKPIYKHALSIYNEQGEVEMWKYLQQFFLHDAREAMLVIASI